MKKSVAFKRITLALILICIFALVVCCVTGCGKKKKNTTVTTTTTTTQQTPPDDDPPVHSHTVFIDESVEATCTTTGLTEGKHCSECGEILVAQKETPKKAHTEEIIPAVEATCTATGLTEGKKCSICGEILVAQVEAPIKSHTYDNDSDAICNSCGYERYCVHHNTVTLAGKAATCTSTGLTEGKKCSDCGEIVVAQEVINLKPHAEVIDAAIMPTCTSSGLTEGKHCSVCFAVLVEQTSVPTLDHTESDWIVGKQPTENATGQKYTKCNSCGQILNSVEIPATHAHNYTEWIEVQSAGCSAFSYKFKICLDCGDQVIDAPEGSDIVHPHEFEKITKEATCTEEGIEYRFECKNCRFVAGEKKIDALDHLLEGNTYKQLDDTYHTQTCSRCGEDVKEVHSHTNYTEIDAPTCTESGKMVGKCDKCGHEGDIIIPPPGHLFIGDCTHVDEDYHLRECERCDEMISQSHTVLTWTTTVESTCTTLGRQEGNCIDCDGHTSRVISENHNFVFVSFTAGSSCMDGGSANYVCSKCGVNRTINLLAPGHDYVYSHTVKEPTCTTAGSAVRVCSRCGVEQEYTLYALGHSYSGGVTIKAATCYQNGTVRFTCQREGCSAIRETTIQKSHNFDGGVVTVAPTCTSKGKIVYTCKSCEVTVEYVLPVVHNLTYHSYVGATCTTDGHTSYYTCNDCGKYFSAYYNSTVYLQCDGRSYSSRNHTVTTYISISQQNTIIGALGHSYTSYYNEYDSENHYRYCTRGCGTLLESGKHTLIEKWEVVTKRVSGGYEYYLLHRWDCSKCGYYAYGEKQNNGTILDPVDPIKISEEHNNHKVIQPTYPTCTESGLDVGLVCGTCGKVIWAQETLPALGHNFVDGICTRCGLTDSRPASQGLEFALNSDNQSYYVKGIGTCTDTDIVIPDTYNDLPVTSIGNRAFYDRALLTSITIPNSVASIGGWAFCDCTSLTNVTIGNSVTSIGEWAFYSCTSLTSITIPNSVTSISQSAFEGCSSLTSITVDENNEYYKSIDGNLYTKNEKTLIQYAIGKQATSFTIPNSVTSIGGDAFYGCSSLTSVTIPDSVTYIGGNTFYNCTSLTSITVDENNKYYKSINGNLYTKDEKTLIQYAIGKDATSFTIPNSVTSIGGDAFYGCSSLTSVTIPDSVTSIGSSAFSGCSSLTSVTIPYSVTSIGYRAFYNCSSLTSIVIPDSVTSIGGWAFYNCSSLTSIVIPDSVTSIGGWAFYECTSLTSITIPNSVTSISQSAFEGCSSLTSVTIPDSVTSIGGWAFYECTSLTSIEIPAGVTSIGPRTFWGCTSLESITIPNSVTSIDSNVFIDCNSLKNVYYTGNVEDWLGISFDGGADSNPTSNGANLYFEGELVTNLVIPDSITSISYKAFNGCVSLTSVTIPDSVTSIGEYAFYGCYYLIEVINKSSLDITVRSSDYGWAGYYAKHIITDESESALKTVGNYIFYDDGTEIYLVKYIGNDNEIILPEYDGGKEYGIWQYAFSNCTSLTSVIIPNSVTSIGNSAFDFCYSLTSVTIPDSVTRIGYRAFYECYSLTSITVDENNEYYKSIDGNLYTKDGKTLIQYAIGKEATSFTIPNSVASISNYAFRNCSSLTSITIPDSVTSIGYYAFDYCDSLTSVTIPNSVTSIHYRAFGYCYKLTIYCEVESQPSGWDEDWNYSNRPVVWDYKNK